MAFNLERGNRPVSASYTTRPRLYRSCRAAGLPRIRSGCEGEAIDVAAAGFPSPTARRTSLEFEWGEIAITLCHCRRWRFGQMSMDKALPVGGHQCRAI